MVADITHYVLNLEEALSRRLNKDRNYYIDKNLMIYEIFSSEELIK